MNLSAPFIERPIATALLMVAVMMAGLMAYRAMPISALPEVDYPTIQVFTDFPGAAPDVIASSVTSPLERQFGQMAGLDTLDSTSSTGASVITLQFSLSTPLDEAEQEVQAAINAANAYLPKDLPYPPVYSKVNPADTAVLTLAMDSDVLPLTRVRELAETRIAQKLSQLSGVGLVSVAGGQRPAVRVEVDTAALTHLGLTLADVDSAIDNANVNLAKGTLDGEYLSWAIGANDQITAPQDYAALVIAHHDGAVIRLGEVARVIEGPENPYQAALVGERPAVVISIRRQPGANVIGTVDRIRATLPQLQSALPGTVRLTVLTDRTDTIRASVHDVQMELLLAIALVVLVIWVFLRDIPATLIPAITVPLSLLATLGVAFALGFSLNNLTLMALTVATGFVVDDAIVMVENVSRHLAQDKSPRQAALDGARQIGFTIVSLSVALIAVLIPLLLMGDVVGRLFREFALTLAAAVLTSAAITLTLTPMLCSRLLHQAAADARKDWFSRIEHGYERLLDTVLHHRGLTLCAVALATLATIAAAWMIPKGFFPTQDTGLVQGVALADPGASFQSVQRSQQRLARLVAADPAVAGLSSNIGIDQTNPTLNSIQLMLRLRDRDDGGDASATVIDRLQQAASAIPGLRLTLQPVQDLTLDAQNGPTRYRVGLSSPDKDALSAWTPKLLAALRADPVFTHVQSLALQQGRQIWLDFDRATASRLGITAQAIDTVLYDAFGQAQVSTIYGTSSQLHVVLSADRAPDDVRQLLDTLHVANSAGAPTPLGSFATLSLGSAPLTITRQGQFPYADVSFDLAPGHALDEGMAHLARAEKAIGLPAAVEAHIEGAAAGFSQSLGSEGVLMLAAVVVVYLMLGMLYESVIHPLTILSTLPPAALGALLALLLSGGEFDVISMIGIVLLIGIVMKNAIMMIDFALEQERREHLAPMDAIRRACALRFRPILMTTLASLLGAVPLAFGSGMGAELRSPLGIAIIGGLLVSQLLTLFSTPVIYLSLHRAEAAVAGRL